MTQILANYSTSISELKKSPSAVIEKSDGEAVAILNHNKPMAYLVPSTLYEEMVSIIDAYHMGMVAETQPAYGAGTKRLTREEIGKIVENTQRIEGYEPAPEEVKAHVRSLIEKHNVKVSF